MRTVDVVVANHGSIILVRPLTDAGKTWIEGNVSGEAQFFGDALAVDHRFFPDLLEGMIGEGLLVA